MLGNAKPPGPALPFTPEQLAVTHEGMFRVVNGSGTAGASRIDIGGIKMAGKTGTAQVRKLVSRGAISDWKSRDHSLFVCYAPADAPRYAMAVVVEHGGFGASAAAPIARDVMTFLFDPATAVETLHALEQGWGGNAIERMAAKYAAAEDQPGASAARPVTERQVEEAVNKAALPSPTPTVAPTDLVVPPPETGPAVPATVNVAAPLPRRT
jgi:penicillin-binding protein 2